MPLRDGDARGSNLLKTPLWGPSWLDSGFLRREEGFPDGGGSGDGRWTTAGAVFKDSTSQKKGKPWLVNVNPSDVSKRDEDRQRNKWAHAPKRTVLSGEDSQRVSQFTVPLPTASELQSGRQMQEGQTIGKGDIGYHPYPIVPISCLFQELKSLGKPGAYPSLFSDTLQGPRPLPVPVQYSSPTSSHPKAIPTCPHSGKERWVSFASLTQSRLEP